MSDENFGLEKLMYVPPSDQIRVGTPPKIAKRREHFIMVPFGWLERLDGASGKAYALALHLLYLDWKAKGAPIKLANSMLKIDGVSRASKWRALVRLESRGLISIERRPGKSPLITLNKHASELKQCLPQI
jgi:hypothetical protein